MLNSLSSNNGPRLNNLKYRVKLRLLLERPRDNLLMEDILLPCRNREDLPQEEHPMIPLLLRRYHK